MKKGSLTCFVVMFIVVLSALYYFSLSPTQRKGETVIELSFIVSFSLLTGIALEEGDVDLRTPAFLFSSAMFLILTTDSLYRAFHKTGNPILVYISPLLLFAVYLLSRLFFRRRVLVFRET